MKAGFARTGACAFAIGCLGAMHAVAQQPVRYPEKLVRIVVPFPPGGGPDVFTRLVAEKLAAKWKQPVIVENRAGAGGNVGAAFVAQAAPDGYTLLSSPPGPLAINGSLFRKLSYDPARWSPVTILTRQPMVLGARKNLQANSVQELIAFARQNPGKLTFGTLGNGSISHLTMAQFLSMADVQLVHVPFQGSSPAAAALMGEQVDIVFDNPITYVGPSRAGRIKILAAGSTQRLPQLADTQSFTEAGFAKLRPYAWLGVVAPPGTPPMLTERISRAMAEALKQPDVQKRLADAATEGVGSTPSDTAAFLAEERAKWQAVIRSANVTVAD